VQTGTLVLITARLILYFADQLLRGCGVAWVSVKNGTIEEIRNAFRILSAERDKRTILFLRILVSSWKIATNDRSEDLGNGEVFVVHNKMQYVHKYRSCCVSVWVFFAITF
jgi:hypothetical protein